MAQDIIEQELKVGDHAVVPVVVTAVDGDRITMAAEHPNQAGDLTPITLDAQQLLRVGQPAEDTLPAVQVRHRALEDLS